MKIRRTCGVALPLVFAALIAHPDLHIEPSLVALLGAGVLASLMPNHA